MVRARTLIAAAAQLVGEGAAATAIAAGEVLVDGIPARSPRARLRAGAVVSLREAPTLRGSVKLRAALAEFAVAVDGRVALDVGAAAGGFTSALLEAGAARVYAVDAGHGQLLGSLRQDARVVNLEAVNVAALDERLVPEPIDIVTVDVSYLSLREAVLQVSRLDIAPAADLIGLVKPMFELRRGTAPTDRASLDAARDAAAAGIATAGWVVQASIDSPVTGAHGAREMLLWARRG